MEARSPTPQPGSTSADDALEILAIVGDDATATVISRVLATDRVTIARDLASGLARVRVRSPDVAFVDVTLGEGAGLALVHHIKAVAPDVTVLALSSARALEIAANAVALGGAGLLMLPVGGDEIMSAVSAVRLGRAERAARGQLEDAAAFHARAAGWISRMAELGEAPDKLAAARHLTEVVAEVTEASGVAVYLPVSEGAPELVRAAASPGLEMAPAYCVEAELHELARRERILVVPLAQRQVRAGSILIRPREGKPAAGRMDGLLKLLATQATTAFALLTERERAASGTLKDPASSAYSFAYYVDVAGREIDKARRHGRRFAIATVAFDGPASSDVPGGRSDRPRASSPTPTETADELLKAVRDTDVVARVDETEFHVLLPETDGLGAHACRRRVLGRFASPDRKGPVVPPGLMVGVACFPHDGHDLAQLVRMARRRGEATRASVVHRLGPEHPGVSDILDVLEWDARSTPGPGDVSAARSFELPIADVAGLATAVVSDALRGGATFLAVAHHATLSLGAAVRAAVGPGRDNVVVHAVDARSSPGCEDVEALAVIAEHGAYALIGRVEGGVVRGVHAADPLLADLLAERLGRAAGLRIFG